MKNALNCYFKLYGYRIILMIVIIFVIMIMLLTTINLYNYEEIKIQKQHVINSYQKSSGLVMPYYDSVYTDNLSKIKYINYVENQKNIDIYNMNPHSKSNLTVEELNAMLYKTGLKFQGQAFKDMEDSYNVNALFAMGVAMHESANGYKKANTHNYFGFRGNKGWMSFSSPYECIQYFGRLIHNNYSNRTTISAIQSKYCPDGSPWAQRVIAHMKQLKDNINL